VVQEFGGRARFVEEDYGQSRLAKRFGVTRYPAIFVGDVLVATPNDFGFYGKGGGGGGRYAPIRSAEGQEKFRADLERMIRLLLDHGTDAARAAAAPAADAGIAEWPAIALTDLGGHEISQAALAGRPVIAEFWATWCPPCRGTLRWLGELKRRYGDRIEVVAIAVESDSAAVSRLAAELHLPLRWVLGTPDRARAFGDVSAVPTMHVFDAAGRRVETYFGAAPDLYQRAERTLAGLVR
jgi:thiol-disulfide isomerase/thioredoxin